MGSDRPPCLPGYVSDLQVFDRLDHVDLPDWLTLPLPTELVVEVLECGHVRSYGACNLVRVWFVGADSVGHAIVRAAASVNG